MISRRLALAALAAAWFAATCGRALAAAAPSVAPVQSFYGVLLTAMRNSQRLGFAGRRDLLAPAAGKFFDFPLMTRLMVGPQWPGLAPTLQQQLAAAFTAFSVANYANRFDGYSGERFEVAPDPIPTGNGDEIVKSQLIQSDGEPVELDYLMHDDNGAWQAIDVYLSGTVSELATRRSEFSSVLRRDGPEALVALLKSRTAELSS